MLRTKTKLAIARRLNTATLVTRKMVGRGSDVRARRGGINWELDLNEGIDLAIYWGLYQKIPPRFIRTTVHPASLIVDVGANIGAHALHFACAMQTDGHVIAIEPTDYAFQKLVANVAINPSLRSHITPIHAALGDGAGDDLTDAFYSRWPLKHRDKSYHPEHGGKFEAASGAEYTTLDALVDKLCKKQNASSKIDMIKVDVDGNELSVLKGALRTLSSDRPVLLVEIAPHVQDEVAGRFEALLRLFGDLRYHLENAASGAALPLEASELRRIITFGASIDVVARPL